MKGSLVEGVDYYLENGRLVLTASYHARRGYCCNSKCRHCPYKGTSDAQPIVITGMPAIKLPK
jgi:hypothetical protein